MTRQQLETVVDELVGIIDGWNESAHDGDRGRANDYISLSLADDGSGWLGRRSPRYAGGDIVEDMQFDNLDGLIALLKSEGGIDLEDTPR